MLDDTVLDKPYAKQIELVGKHWSGEHKGTVKAIFPAIIGLFINSASFSLLIWK